MPLLAEADPPKNRRVPVWALVALAVIVIVPALSLPLYKDPHKALALRTPGAIVGITRGDETLYIGTNWQRALLWFAPQLQERIGGRVVPKVKRSVNPSSLIIWKNLGRQYSDLIPLQEGPFAGSPPAYVVDDQGKRQEIQVRVTTVELDIKEATLVGFELEASELAKLPHSSRELGVSFAWELPYGTGHPEFTIPNPGYLP